MITKREKERERDPQRKEYAEQFKENMMIQMAWEGRQKKGRKRGGGMK